MKVTSRSNSGDLQLTPNFYLSEFTTSNEAVRRGIQNVPDPLAVKNLYALAQLLEQCRKALGGKIISISSGLRVLELNRAIGSDDTSDHIRGEAADWNCRAYGTPLQVASAIAKSGIKFGQLIHESGWVHISIPDGTARDGEVLSAHFAPNEKTTYTRGLLK